MLQYAIGVYCTVFTFIESAHFSKQRPLYLDDDEFMVLQQYLIHDPEAGSVIPHTGGIRKVRWSSQEKGKRGGLRVIYMLRSVDGEIWLLTLYSKSKHDDIPKNVLLKLKEAFNND